MNKYWEAAWAAQQAEQLKNTGVSQKDWKASGRATKANPNKEDGDWWNVEGSKMVDSWISWRNGTHPLTMWEVQPGVPAIELGLTPIRINHYSIDVHLHWYVIPDRCKS